MTDADDDDDTYNSIDGISFKFMRHCDYKYRDVHHKLNGHYGEDIYDIDAFFNTDRTDINKDIDLNIAVTNLIITSMCENGANKDKLRNLFAEGSLILKWHQYTSDNYSRISNRTTFQRV